MSEIRVLLTDDHTLFRQGIRALISAEPDMEKRRRLVWQIEQKLAGDAARPILFYPYGVVCWQPKLKGLTVMSNSIYNGSRFEDLTLAD